MMYQVTASFLVSAPDQHFRAVEKVVHSLVQGLAGDTTTTADGTIEIVGASVQSVKEAA